MTVATGSATEVSPSPQRTGIGPEWVCTNCGSPGGTPSAARPSLDERYAVGYCDTCSNPNPDKPRKTPRPTSQLIRMARFNRDQWQVEKDRAELTRLVKEFAAGKDKVQLTEQQAVRLVTLWDRYGFSGFEPSPALRESVDVYLQRAEHRAAHKPTKDKRSRGA